MDVSSSVSKSGSKSWSRLRSLGYAWWLRHRALGRGVCIYTDPGCTALISDRWAASLLPGGTSGVLGGCGVGSGVGCLSRSGGGAPVPLHHQRVSRFCTVPLCQGRQPSVWFSWSLAACLSIAAFTFLCLANSTTRFFTSWTSTRGFLIRNSVSSLAAHNHPLLAILAILEARRISDCSSCTRPPCLAIVAGMLKTCNEISRCIYILDSANTWTMYASVASSNVVKACLVHSRGFLSLNWSAKIPELTTSWCWTLRTARTNALVNHGGFPLQVARNWSRSSLHTPGASYLLSWRSSTSTWLYSHLIACCFLFLLLPVLRTIFHSASTVMFSVAAFAASRWAEWCLHCRSVSVGGVWQKRPSFCSILFHAQLPEVFVQPRFAAVEVTRWW